MSCFVIVQVDQDYDYIEGVNFVDVFKTEEEAVAYILNAENKDKESHRIFAKYVDEWVDSIKILKTDNYNEWKEFVNKYMCCFAPAFKEEGFKEELRIYLKSRSITKLKGFNPPKCTHDGYNLFIVEVPVD